MDRATWLAMVNLLLSWRNTFGFRLAPALVRELANDLAKMEDALSEDERTGSAMWLVVAQWLKDNEPQEKASE